MNKKKKNAKKGKAKKGKGKEGKGKEGKFNFIAARITDDELAILDVTANALKVNRSELVRMLINRIPEKIKELR